ncbi:MAG: glycosyl hydrolase [Candidatus Gottesmanbacteria bacterium]|nr:glycosyl hydrolase [Candidatus Gottesmanbacteria bacterium]
MHQMKLFLLLFIFLLARPAIAIYDPLSVPNNKYGIHVADPNDISKVKDLVNSTQGDWGYVTLVIPDNERRVDVWQPVFERMKRDHLIPIVRLATHVEGGVWIKPSLTDAHVWVNFLKELPWPTKNRYIILFNEPNHAKEWGGTVSPHEYADVFMAYANALRQASEDFFILPAGLDASAPNGRDTMDEELFLRWMIIQQPDILNVMDGLTSHSYPNPGFSGSPYAQGRGTLRTYEWELKVLADLGSTKRLPIFITETGWAHNGNAGKQTRLSPDDVSQYVEIASKTVWNNPQIAAVTPFLFSYQDGLFAMFSWLRLTTREPYSFYRSYQHIAKMKGEPLTYPTNDYLALIAHPLNL